MSADTTRPHHPRRSDATRAAILQAARDRFATDGYERATIRAIARDAAIDPSMVMRYYGSKEGLFAAACEFDLALPDLSGVARDEVGAALVRHFLHRWEQDEVLTALLRAGVTHPAAADRMRGIFRDQLQPLVAALNPDPEPDAEQEPDGASTGTRAALVAAHVLGMALVRYVVRLPPAVDLSREETVAWLAPSVQRCLTAAHPLPGGAGT